MQSDVTHLTLQDQLLTWFEKNKRQVMIGSVAVAVIAAIAGFYVWHQEQVQTDASEALTKITSPASAGGAPATTDAILKVAADFPGSEAAKRAILLAAGNYFAEGKYKEAQAQFEKFLRDNRESAFAGQALLGVASCKDALGLTADAVTAYKDIVDHHGSDSIAPQARFALGRLYETQGKLELARDLYQQVAQTDPNGPLGNEAGMRMMELISKNPALLPAKPAMPSPSALNIGKP